MFQKYITAILCTLMTFAFISCFAKEVDLSCSIAKVEGHKVYLKPGTIQIANNGIFINVAGQLRSVNHLEMDDQGVYFDTLKQAAFCPACGLPTLGGFCINPGCPTKG